MNSKSIINILAIALLIAVIAVAFIAFRNSVPVPALLATVSWNG